jgi:Secretion system C-terminal sorting domain
MKKNFAFIVLLFFSLFAWAQGNTFAKKYTPPPLYNVLENDNNSIFTIGIDYTKGAVVTHLNSFGDTIWSKVYSCPTCSFQGGSVFDFIKLKDGNLLLAESFWSIGQQGYHFLIKIDTSGNVIWGKYYSYNSSFSAKLTEGSDRSLYLRAGRILLKTDKLGNLKWCKSNPLFGYSFDIVAVSDGVITCGYGNFNDSTGAYKDAVLVKTDTAGNIMWKKRYDGSIVDEAQSVIVSRDSSLLITGSTFAGAGWYDVLLMKTDLSGNILWLKTYGDTTANQGTSIVETPSRDLLIVGSTYINHSLNIPNTLLIKTDSTGIPYFMKTYGDSLSHRGNNVHYFSDNTYVILTNKGAILKMDTTGNLSCFTFNKNLSVNSPVFNDNHPYTIIDSIEPTTSFPVNIVSEYYSVTTQPFCNTLEINETTKGETNIIIAPNPFTLETTINFKEEQKNTILKIFNLLGEELKTINFSGKQLTIEKGNINAGIYFVQTTDERKKINIKKIIIQ